MAYYQLEDGTLQTAAQLKRGFMGKIPSPRQRRMLGIRTLTKAQYEKAKTAHLPVKYYRRGKGGKKVWSTKKNPPSFGDLRIVPSEVHPGHYELLVADFIPAAKRIGWIYADEFDTLKEARDAAAELDPEAPLTIENPSRGCGSKRKKNPTHRKGSLTHARVLAKRRLESMPFGSVVMVGQWIDTGKYEAKTGGGMNWKHKYFMPVEQWTSTHYKTKPGKKMVKMTVQGKNPYVDPHAKTRKMKPYKKTTKRSSKTTTRRMSTVSKKNPLGWQPLTSKKEAASQAVTHAFLAKQNAGIGKKGNKYAVLPGISTSTKTAFGWKVLGVVTPKEAERAMREKNTYSPATHFFKGEKVRNQRALERLARRGGLTGGVGKKSKKASRTPRDYGRNPHGMSMFGEDKPDWLIYAKAPGMGRFEPLDLSQGGTVKNLMYASRFPHSDEAKVDKIIASLKKQAPQIKVEKRSASGTRHNPRRVRKGNLTKSTGSNKSIADRARTALQAAGIEGSKTHFRGRSSERTFKIWSISSKGPKTILTIHIPNVNRRQQILNAVRNRAGLKARWIDESEKGVGFGRWVKYQLTSK